MMLYQAHMFSWYQMGKLRVWDIPSTSPVEG
jgi:hypothetical protein